MQRNVILVAVAAMGLVVAGGVYVKQSSMEQPASTTPAATESRAGATAAQTQSTPPGIKAGTLTQPLRTSSKQIPSDPRLLELMVSADNGLIEFVTGSDGKVVAEIDQDPNSLGFKKPLREYTYAGDNVIGLISYQYFGDYIQVTKKSVSYKPDGSVDQYLESMTQEYGNKGKE